VRFDVRRLHGSCSSACKSRHGSHRLWHGRAHRGATISSTCNFGGVAAGGPCRYVPPLWICRSSCSLCGRPEPRIICNINSWATVYGLASPTILSVASSSTRRQPSRFGISSNSSQRQCTGGRSGTRWRSQLVKSIRRRFRAKNWWRCPVSVSAGHTARVS